MLRAQAREGTGDLDRALSDYQEAARLDPKKVAAFTAQGGIGARRAISTRRSPPSTTR